MDTYIGISEDRLHHIIGVARKAYSLSKEMGYNEEFCRRMFMLGYLHDVGYEFSKEQKEHPDVSADLLASVFGSIIPGAKDGIAYDAIKNHGKYTDKKTLEWKILNMADMLIDSKGNEVDVTARLDDIKDRYGEYSG